jgi:hypothetical protein
MRLSLEKLWRDHEIETTSWPGIFLEQAFITFSRIVPIKRTGTRSVVLKMYGFWWIGLFCSLHLSTKYIKSKFIFDFVYDMPVLEGQETFGSIIFLTKGYVSWELWLLNPIEQSLRSTYSGLAKKFPAIYGYSQYITMLTRASVGLCPGLLNPVLSRCFFKIYFNIILLCVYFPSGRFQMFHVNISMRVLPPSRYCD